jgi:hydroxymethylbilane synthase
VRKLRIGSRGSPLALWQANFVGGELAQLHGAAWEIVIIKTSGDRFQQGGTPAAGQKGLFTKELEEALLDHRTDLAVHSMKDVPTEVPPGLAFPAVTRREDVRDCLLSRSGARLADMPPGARIGTSSLRRRAQLLRARLDLSLVDVRGNVDTRIRKMEQGEFDAIVLAKAGLDRLGYSARITEVLECEVSLPAVGQGALGIESRGDDAEVVEAVSALNDPATRVAVTAERALLAELQGGCQVPLGAWGRIESGALLLDARVLSADGRECISDFAKGNPENAVQLGRELARKMIAAGAARLLEMAGREVGHE